MLHPFVTGDETTPSSEAEKFHISAPVSAPTAYTFPSADSTRIVSFCADEPSEISSEVSATVGDVLLKSVSDISLELLTETFHFWLTDCGRLRLSQFSPPMTIPSLVPPLSDVSLLSPPICVGPRLAKCCDVQVHLAGHENPCLTPCGLCV